MIARHLIERLGEVEVERLALFEADLPRFDGAAIEARYARIHAEPMPPEATTDWERIERMVTHLLRFDTWLISVPMWNFGIPYALKHYIDLVTQPGLAFSVDETGAVVGLAAGRQVILVASGALDTRPGAPRAALDHQVAYLTDWLAFIGVTDVRVVRLQPTYGAPELVEQTMAQGYSDAEALAADLLRPSRV
jgi:FMN-dependent NADH-azoreductase